MVFLLGRYTHQWRYVLMDWYWIGIGLVLDWYWLAGLRNQALVLRRVGRGRRIQRVPATAAYSPPATIKRSWSWPRRPTITPVCRSSTGTGLVTKSAPGP